MKKIIGTIVFVFLFSGIVFGASAIDKSRIFMKAGDFYQAKRILKAEYQKNPSARVLYLLGTAYLMSGDYKTSLNTYEKSIRLDSAYKTKVGRMLADQGSALLANQNYKNAKICFKRSVLYCPNYKETLPVALINKGRDILFNTGDINKAFRYFDISSSLNSEYNKTIVSCFWDVAKLFSTDSVDHIRAKALTYSYISLFTLEHKKEMGLEFARMAKLTSIPSELRKSLKSSAKSLLEKDEFEKIFPPPSWKQIGKTKTYIGTGTGKGQYLLTLKIGTDFELGDKIIVRGKNAEVTMYNRWNKLVNGKFSAIMKHGNIGEAIGVRAPKGEKIYLSAERFE